MTGTGTEPLEGLRPQARSVRPSTRPAALWAAAFALVLSVLTIRVTDAPAWTPRYALLPLEAAVGAPLVVSLLGTRLRRAALGALAFAAIAAIGMVTADNPLQSFWGTAYSGTGMLFVLGGVGIWAIGACAGRAGERLVEGALLIGVLLNAVVALVQRVLDLSSLGLPLISTQPTGLVGQPAQLGALLVAGLWLIGKRDVTTICWGVGVVVVAASIEATGERLPLILAAGVALMLLRGRTRRQQALFAVLVLSGLLLGYGLSGVSQSTVSASGRLSSSIGDDARVENYGSALEVGLRRPLLGYGPGRYLAATTPVRSRTLESYQPDTFFVDGHDWPLHWFVTTGVLGVLALLGWLLAAGRHAHGPLVGFAAVIALVQLLQPMDPGTTMLALLALGAASWRAGEGALLVAASMRAVLVIGGLGLTGLLLYGGWLAYQGQHGHASMANHAASLLPAWPERASDAARAALARTDLPLDARLGKAENWAQATVQRDEANPITLGSAGYVYLLTANTSEAERTFRLLLAVDPNSTGGLAGMGVALLHEGRSTEAVTYLERALALDPTDAVARGSLQEALTAAGR